MTNQKMTDDEALKKLIAMQTPPRRWVSIEEWEPGTKVEIIVTGSLGEDQLQAIEGFVSRQRKRVSAETERNPT